MSFEYEKNTWPDGPWMTEPDTLDWVDEATDMDCKIVRNAIGALCGYVAVPPGHPAHGKDYDDVGVTVHGGLTYARPCQEGGEVCHVPRPGYPDDVWWLGFDCAHYMDYCPGMDRYGEKDHRRYRDIEYVQVECAELALQLKEMQP